MHWKSISKYSVGLALGAALLWWILRDSDVSTMRAQIAQASIGGLLLSAALNIFHNVFRVLRWRALLAPLRPNVPFRPMFSAVILGYLTTWTVPGRLGELVRPALLSGREELPLGPVVGSVFADRLLDGAAVLLLFGVALWITPLDASVLPQGTIGVATIAVVLVLCAVVGFSLGRGRLESWIAGRSGALAWIGRAILGFSRGTDALRSPRLVGPILLYTFLCWLTIGASTWVGLYACGIEFPFAGIFLLMPLLVLGIAVPTPGGAGSYHAAMIFGLTRLFAVEENAATASSFVVHGLVVVPIVLLGLVILLIDRISFGDLLRAGRQVRDLGAA